MWLDRAGARGPDPAMGFLRWLWRSAQIWPDPGMGLRPGSQAAVLVTFLTLLFVVIGVVLVLLGADLNAVDRWIDAQGGWLDAVGAIAFKALLALVFALCLIVIAGALFDRRNPDRPGWGMALGALIVAYFAGASLFAD